MSTLPAPDESRPGQAIVIYDGQCKFCIAQVRKLAFLDVRQALAFLSLHDPRVAKRWPHLTHDQLMQQMYVVTPQNECLGGVLGLRYLSRRLPLLWPLALWLHLPGSLPMWRWAYRWVAQRRYWFAGRQAACDGGTCQRHAEPTRRSAPDAQAPSRP